MLVAVEQEAALLQNLRFLISLAWYDLLLTHEEREALERIADHAHLSAAGRRQAQSWIDRMPGFPEQLALGCEGFAGPDDLLLSAYYVAYVDDQLNPQEEIAIAIGAELLGVGPRRMMEIKSRFLELRDREEALSPPEWRSHRRASIVPAPVYVEPEHAYTKDDPFRARVLVNEKLTGPGSWKDVRHIAVDVRAAGPSLQYKVGDALGVHPSNDRELVERVLEASGREGSELVGDDSMPVSLRSMLESGRTITKLGKVFFARLADHFPASAKVHRLLDESAAEELAHYMAEMDVADALEDLGAPDCAPDDLVAALMPMRGRLYSIASSPRVHPGEVHMCVRRVEYEVAGKTRHGVASTYMAHCEPGTRMPVYLHATETFLCPTGATDLVMCGPGTGIAPFRAFTEERVASGATGTNWLFFGEQQEGRDFLYGEQLSRYVADGALRISIAWSRTGERAYVQDRIRESAAELFALFERGAVFAISGDARRMAKDVDAALHELVGTCSGKGEPYATEYLTAMKRDGRYLRDVY